MKTLNGELGEVFKRWYPDIAGRGTGRGGMIPSISMLSLRNVYKIDVRQVDGIRPIRSSPWHEEQGHGQDDVGMRRRVMRHRH